MAIMISNYLSMAEPIWIGKEWCISIDLDSVILWSSPRYSFIFGRQKTDRRIKFFIMDVLLLVKNRQCYAEFTTFKTVKHRWFQTRSFRFLHSIQQSITDKTITSFFSWIKSVCNQSPKVLNSPDTGGITTEYLQLSANRHETSVCNIDSAAFWHIGQTILTRTCFIRRRYGQFFNSRKFRFSCILAF